MAGEPGEGHREPLFPPEHMVSNQGQRKARRLSIPSLLLLVTAANQDFQGELVCLQILEKGRHTAELALAEGPETGTLKLNGAV